MKKKIITPFLKRNPHCVVLRIYSSNFEIKLVVQGRKIVELSEKKSVAISIFEPQP